VAGQTPPGPAATATARPTAPGQGQPRDNTEDGVATDLMRMGVPKERIVLAFHRPDVRAHSGFAVA
jgi:hypothetical protein